MMIGAKYSIEAIDTMNVVLYEHRTVLKKDSKNFGKDQKMPIAFLPTVAKAYEHIIDREINGTGLEDVETVVKKIEELKRVLLAAIKEGEQ